MQAWQNVWSDEQVLAREKDIAREVQEALAEISKPGNYVNRKCLAADKRFLRELRSEMKRRKLVTT